MADAMRQPPNKFFRMDENGIFALTIGYAMTDRGPGWFDRAVLFCPFCGESVQSLEEIRMRVASAGR
jgi:hypothetical protein